MRLFISLFIILFFTETNAQEIINKEIKTDINEVTVFIQNAQVTRKSEVYLSKGILNLKFSNLSPFIDAKSIQLKSKGNLKVLSVNHQQNFLKKQEKQKEISELDTQLDLIYGKIELEQTYLSIIKEELQFLQENRDIGGKNQQVNIDNLRDASNFYSTKLTNLKLKEIERNKTLQKLTELKDDLKKQMNSLTDEKEYPSGEIIVKIDVEQNTTANFELSYIVKNAGWFPSYDIRAKNINEPIQIIYKANVRQDTKVDWNNVKLRLSSAEPNASGVIPELQTYLLNYNSLPPKYSNKSLNQITGIVSDGQGPLPGVSVLVEGTTIGTSTDFDGRYTLSIPPNAKNLVFSFIGFNTETLPIRNNIMNVSLDEDAEALEEVVVIGYGSKQKRNRNLSKKLQGKVEGLQLEDQKNTSIPTTLIENQTSVDFEIKMPYSIKSDNKSYMVDIESFSLDAFYQYYSVPKIEKSAFLTAGLTGWEKYHFLEGEANIFFEDTYVGKSLLDVRFASDTLKISLGRDKNVSVNREKTKDFTQKQFIGNKKEESREWKITVKNNKNQSINMLIYDQIPISTLEEIQVLTNKLSSGNFNKETGIVKWEFNLEPKKSKELELKYSVKYPKYRNLVIE